MDNSPQEYEPDSLHPLSVSRKGTPPIWTPISCQPSNLRFSHIDFVDEVEHDIEDSVQSLHEFLPFNIEQNNNHLPGDSTIIPLSASRIAPTIEENLSGMMRILDTAKGNSLTESNVERIEAYVGNLEELRETLAILIKNNLNNQTENVLSSLLELQGKINDTLQAYDLLDEDQEEEAITTTTTTTTTAITPDIATTICTNKESSIRQIDEICPICSDSIKCSLLSCEHYYCLECLNSYVRQEVTNGRISLQCPSRCGALITEQEIEEFGGELVYKKWQQFSFFAKLEVDPTTRWCPRADCNTALSAASSSSPLLTCPNCSTLFCYNCGDPWHEGLTCKKNQKKNRKKGDNKNKRWKSRNTKNCPRCRVAIEKNKGCPHMICQHCRYEFCWNCMGDYKKKGICYKKSSIGVFAVTASAGLLVGGAIVLVLALPVCLLALPVYGGFRLKRKLHDNRIERELARQRQEIIDSLVRDDTSSEEDDPPL